MSDREIEAMDYLADIFPKELFYLASDEQTISCRNPSDITRLKIRMMAQAEDMDFSTKYNETGTSGIINIKLREGDRDAFRLRFRAENETRRKSDLADAAVFLTSTFQQQCIQFDVADGEFMNIHTPWLKGYHQNYFNLMSSLLVDLRGTLTIGPYEFLEGQMAGKIFLVDPVLIAEYTPRENIFHSFGNRKQPGSNSGLSL